MDHSIVIDLFEEKLLEIESLVRSDVKAFVEVDMWPLYRAFQRQGVGIMELEQELLQFVQSHKTPSIHSWTFVDEWVTYYDVGVLNKCRTLLSALYLEFENSAFFQWIGERFEMSREEILNSADQSRVYAWFVLWMTHIYPNTALFLLGKEVINPYSWLQEISLKKLVFYLPKFIFWSIRSCLFTAKNRFLVKKLAEGEHIRHISSCPASFTKKMAHFFVNAPKGLHLEEAAWYAIVLGLGGNQLLFTVFKNHYGNSLKDMSFIKPIINFFVTIEEQIEVEELQEFLGYFQHLWDEKESFSLKGWTLASLRRRTNQWYEEVNQRWVPFQAIPGFDKTWPGASYEPFERKENDTVYRIVQLTSIQELYEEGRKMKHCVGGYAQKCQQQGISIWSLREEKFDQSQRLVTLEISKDHRIVQARRKFNGAPKKFHWELIKKWAEKERLSC